MSLSKLKRRDTYSLPRHPWSEDRRAADLTRLNVTRHIKQLKYIFGATKWWEFMKDFVNETRLNRYRGFKEVKVTYWDGRCFSLFYQKFDFYLVAVHDGRQLYESGISGDNQWLFRAILTGYKESYISLLNKKRIVGTVLSFKIFEDAVRQNVSWNIDADVVPGGGGGGSGQRGGSGGPQGGRGSPPTTTAALRATTTTVSLVATTATVTRNNVIINIPTYILRKII
nr:hypothetical protein [Tanacetum cinerariifolium]